jgi:hypothetical protein
VSGTPTSPHFQPPDPTPTSAGPIKNRLAVASLILGLVSLCLGILTGIPAIICGIMGLFRISRQPRLQTGKGMATSGIILGCVGIVLWALALAAYPSLIKKVEKIDKIKEQAEATNCALHLKNLGLAARIYAVDHGDRLPKSYLEIKDEIASPKILFCPADKQHRPVESWNDFDPSTSTYEFLSPGAGEADVARKPVFRCRIHHFYVIGDGSVIQGEPLTR